MCYMLNVVHSPCFHPPTHPTSPAQIIARDLFCEPGQLQLPISFAVPSQEPVRIYRGVARANGSMRVLFLAADMLVRCIRGSYVHVLCEGETGEVDSPQCREQTIGRNKWPWNTWSVESRVWGGTNGCGMHGTIG